MSARRAGLRRIWWAGTAALVFAGCASGDGPAPLVPTERDLAGLGDPVVPQAGNRGYDARHYTWQLKVDPRTERVTARATMEAVALEARERVTLDFSGPPVSAVSVDGEAASHARSGDKLVVAAPLAASQRFEIEVGYEGVPAWVPGPHAIRTASILPGDAAAWAPLNDTPLDPARYTLRITVPPPFSASASGRLVATEPHADGRTFVWEVDMPVSEVGLAVGEFDIARLAGTGGVPIDAAIPEGASIEPSAFARVPEMLSFLEDRLGGFPFPSLGLTWTGERSGGADSTPARIYLAEAGELVLVHELAHQWIGGSVGTTSSRDAWLREGLPTYAELLWTEREAGAAAAAAWIEDRRRGLGSSTRAPLDVRERAERGDDVTYVRGALTFHALEHELGERSLHRALRAFFAEHAGASASTEDFIATVERVAGRDLDAFFSAWLEEERLPRSPA